MAEPKVLDARGNGIGADPEVRRLLPNGRLGGIVGKSLGLSGDRKVLGVEWMLPGRNWTVRFYPVTRRFPFSRTHTCPDLVLLDDNEKEAARDAG